MSDVVSTGPAVRLKTVSAGRGIATHQDDSRPGHQPCRLQAGKSPAGLECGARQICGDSFTSAGYLGHLPARATPKTALMGARGSRLDVNHLVEDASISSAAFPTWGHLARNSGVWCAATSCSRLAHCR